MARDKDTGITKKTPVVVDEQSKAAAMRAAATAVPAAKKAIAKTADELAIDRINAQIAKSQTSVSNLEKISTELAALNPDVMTKAKGETNSEFLARKQAAQAQARQNEMAQNPLLNKAVKPTDAPAGKYYAWIGGTDTGSWQLYDIPGYGVTSSASSASTVNTISSEPSSTATLVSTDTDEYGNTIGFYSDGSQKILVKSGNKYKTTVDEDAYAILQKTFADYGLDDPDILKAIQGYMERGLGSEQAGLELRKTTSYINRFRGNEIRRAAGLNVLSEDQYLGLEKSYNETLRSYGLQGYFGTDRKAATAAMADIIGNDISAVEFKDRIDMVSTRVNNADPNIKATLRGFYNITDTDLVKYFLNPKENLPKLQEKVTAAEIGSEFIKQGLVTGVLSAEEFAKLGIDKAAAAKGAETIANILPETRKLGSIYDEEAIDYTQKTAEEEVLKGLDSARRKRLRLAEKEIGSFSGSAGLARGALSDNRSSAF